MRGGYAFSGDSYRIFRQFFGTENPYCDITLPPSEEEIRRQMEDLHVPEEDINITIECSLLEMMTGTIK